MKESLVDRAESLFQELDDLPLMAKIEAINKIRQRLHVHSPFVNEPVDCVQWVREDLVEGNDYNPNSIAPPELKLLELSINKDGFTQPIVSHRADARHVVVDGFHRQQIGRKSKPIYERLHGYLPIVNIRAGGSGRSNRIASTIRHNRARGIHGIQPMTSVVVTLLESGWSEGMVAESLGMDAEEVHRFMQISGLPGLFRYHAYSRSWD